MARTASAMSVALSIALVTHRATAQSLEPRSVPSRNVEAFSFASPSMENRYDVVVGLPVGYRAGADKKYPALVVTDGAFPVALDAARSLRAAEAAEDVIVIGVSAPFEEGDTAFVRRRVYEFSPPGWAMTDPFGADVSKTCREFTHAAPGRCVGGAPKFLNFLVAELLPRLAAKYPIDLGRLGLFGVSAGGFFASWVIFQPTSPFRTYIIQSPAMAYGDGEIFRQEAQYATAHRDLEVGIYLASGSLEMDDPYLEGVGRIVSGQAHFSAMLRSRKYPGLTLYTEILPGLGHSDAAATALARGIRLLYASGRPDSFVPR